MQSEALITGVNIIIGWDSWERLLVLKMVTQFLKSWLVLGLNDITLLCPRLSRKFFPSFVRVPLHPSRCPSWWWSHGWCLACRASDVCGSSCLRKKAFGPECLLPCPCGCRPSMPEPSRWRTHRTCAAWSKGSQQWPAQRGLRGLRSPVNWNAQKQKHKLYNLLQLVQNRIK